MGRDYKDIVSSLWNKVPAMQEKAERNVEKLESKYNNLLSSIIEAFLNAETDEDEEAAYEQEEALDETEESLYNAYETLDRCNEMMESLEGDEFLTIVENYFDGFFELDGDIE